MTTTYRNGWITTLLMASAMTCNPALAQSNVLIYGTVDAALSYISNINGHASVQEISGIMNGNRLGMRGTEDLGGGNKAIFALESGFNVDDGSLGQGSPGTTRIFGRQAFVGLQTPVATISLGRQYDAMFQMLAYSAGPFLSSYWLRPAVAGNLVGSNGSSADFDRLGGARVDNAVKVASEAIPGLSLSALYGLGERPGAAAPGSTYSFGAHYARERFAAGASYTNFKEPNGSGNYVTWAVGSSYQIDAVTLNALYTNTRFTATQDKIDVIEVSAKYQILPSTYIGGAYSWVSPNNGTANVILKGKRQQFGLTLDYAFSKRTDVYTAAIHQRVSEGNAAQIFTLPSTGTGHGTTQTLVSVGLRHRF
ncbi:Outer membrane porin (plasmid) [Cupriavidus necator H850]|uniref:porin n=1 Tax=Cupriavidus necator TaxID=106590 RepID=UPI00129D227F|nr:porin [Cupriavidus necator]KAI3603829.1 Outer membrane porin [Cupriavidus necator H850]